MTKHENERLVRFKRLEQEARRLFEGDKQLAHEWMQRPARGVGGRTPVEMLDGEGSAEVLFEFMNRLERGVVV